MLGGRPGGRVRQVAGTFKYYLTTLGRSALVAALKIKGHLLIPTLPNAPAS